tara:strand:- start:73 stop:267 length:195 start_codon:yes stop_codon:yes gene_type:complete
MNYPDGMTKEDWQHINGVNHWGNCPQNEGNDGDCTCAEMQHMAYLDAEERREEVRREREIMGGL